jgi:soluble lytic murein transglycosylase-like protein
MGRYLFVFIVIIFPCFLFLSSCAPGNVAVVDDLADDERDISEVRIGKSKTEAEAKYEDDNETDAQAESIKTATLEKKPPETNSESSRKKKWPFSRKALKKELVDMLEDWGESAFEVDDELVRHVVYFYKYYAIKDFEKSNRTIQRSRKYLPYILQVFEEYRLPEEIAFALPFVESSFVVNARSHVGAGGMFQFMKSTAKIYDLKVSRRYDERNDYKKAAVACAKYLRNNRNVFASSVLSLGSYHHGTGNVSKVLLNAAYADERKFGPIWKSRKLGRYSREYIPQCLSAALIYRFMKQRQIVSIPQMRFNSRTFKRVAPVKALEREVRDLYTMNPDLANVRTTYNYASTNGYVLLSGVTISNITPSSAPVWTARAGASLEKPPVKRPRETKTKRSSYHWPRNPGGSPSGNHKLVGRPKYIRYVFQEGNDLNVVASIFGTTAGKIKQTPENRYLRKRSPRPGDVIRIDGLSPTAQKIGGGGVLCNQTIQFKTRRNETLAQVHRRAVQMVQSTCGNRYKKWRMGTDVTPELIFYWNRELLDGVADKGPAAPMEGGLPLVVYSDYLWKKALASAGDRKSNSTTRRAPRRKTGKLYITYHVQDDNLQDGNLVANLSDVFRVDENDLISWNPWLKKANSNPTKWLGRKKKLTIRNCPNDTQKFGNPGVVCGKGRDGKDTRLLLKRGETLSNAVQRAKRQVRSCGGNGDGITKSNILYWNADALKGAGVTHADAAARKRVRLTIYSDFY